MFTVYAMTLFVYSDSSDLIGWCNQRQVQPRQTNIPFHVAGRAVAWGIIEDRKRPPPRFALAVRCPASSRWMLRLSREINVPSNERVSPLGKMTLLKSTSSTPGSRPEAGIASRTTPSILVPDGSPASLAPDTIVAVNRSPTRLARHPGYSRFVLPRSPIRPSRRGRIA